MIRTRCQLSCIACMRRAHGRFFLWRTEEQNSEQPQTYILSSAHSP